MIGRRYTADFHAGVAEAGRDAAGAIVPIVLELVELASVVDVGSGSGAWLAVFAEHGVEDILGIDGGDIPSEQLQIPEERFLARDLAQPLTLDRRFDLAVSLEVAEHLPETAAAGFVASLVALAPVVLFSAAIPAQGGTSHLNEQWPEYWAAHFGREGYVAVDCIRRRVWSDRRVAFWYAQNTIVYVDEARLQDYPRLLSERLTHGAGQLSLVHPDLYEKRVLSLRVRGVATTLLRAFQLRRSRR